MAWEENRIDETQQEYSLLSFILAHERQGLEEATERVFEGKNKNKEGYRRYCCSHPRGCRADQEICRGVLLADTHTKSLRTKMETEGTFLKLRKSELRKQYGNSRMHPHKE